MDKYQEDIIVKQSYEGVTEEQAQELSAAIARIRRRNPDADVEVLYL